MPRQRRTREGRTPQDKSEKQNVTRTRISQYEANRDHTESDDAASLCDMPSSTRRESHRRTNATAIRRRTRKRPSAAASANEAMTSDIVLEPGSTQDSANFKLGEDAEEVESESDSEEEEANTEKNSEEDEVQTDIDKKADSCEEDNVSQYRQALRRKFKLDVYPAKADGNCLFRSVAQQMYGDQQHHIVIREFCVSYMQARAVTFQPFVSSSMAGFTSHLQRMRKPVDTCDDTGADKKKSALTSTDMWGGEPEIKAMSELYQRPVQVFCPDDTQGAVLLNRYGEVFEEQDLWPIRLNFYSHGHYDSAVPLGASVVLLQSAPGELERRRVLGLGAGTQCSTAGVTRSQLAATFDDEEETMDEILRQSEAEELEKQTQKALLESRKMDHVRGIITLFPDVSKAMAEDFLEAANWDLATAVELVGLSRL